MAGGLNEKGSVNGAATVAGDTAFHAFLWEKGLMTDLGTLGGPDSFSNWPLNNHNEVGGGAESSTPDPLGENYCGFGTGLECLPFLWQKGVMNPLPLLGGNNGFAHEINNRGQVAGNAENTTPDLTCPPRVLQRKPVLWEGGEVQELPTLPGDSEGDAFTINDKGQAAGLSGSCSDPMRHAVLWQRGTVTDLGNLGGTMGNFPIDINNQGQVVGASNLPGDTNRDAFLWQNGVMTDLGTLPGDVASSGDGINSKGQVVGGSFDTKGNGRAFLWQNGVMTDLNTLIPLDSPLTLLEATGTINSRAQIAGIALQKNTGQVHAFLATPCGEEHADDQGCKDDSENLSGKQGETSERPKVALPENVRKLLRQQLARKYHIHGLGVGPAE